MARDDGQMTTAKRAYRNAVEEGNRQEQARWANVIGDILKNRGEYVEALKWLRIDYEVSVKYLSEKHLLPTCQSLGELYLRLQHFEDALIYQKKHLELAKNADDLVEQQRASTQLGRTYHEMFLKSEYDHSSVRNAKKYFTSAMKLAQTLKESQPSNKCNFLKEYIDAHNNIGMLEMDLDNLEEAQRILTTGLQICDEEEVIEDDDGRSRLHHNLGNVYMKLRKWDKAREHIEKDIVICNTIGHCQGEAKGYINLGELHYNVQKFEEANLCYQKALDLAKSMEDEDALVGEINQNVQTVKQAVKVMEEIKREEQNLKKLTRSMGMHRGTSGERKCLLQQYTSLDDLIEKSRMIFAWMKHREFVKMKKKVAQELCDKVKLADSFLDLGESYHKLRNFKKALKWYRKSWKTYNSIGNLEGQALAKINMGNILDSLGDWAAALDAFDEAYRIASRANLPSRQLSALENMHYSQMIRFDNLEEARRLQLLIDKLKKSNTSDLESPNIPRDCCSETETEEDDRLSNNSDLSYPPKTSKSISRASKDDLEDDIPLVSLLRSRNCSSKLKATHVAEQFISTKRTEASSTSMPRSTSSQAAGRKRVRQVLLDDDDDNDELRSPRRGVCKSTQEVVTSNEATSKFARSSSIPTNLEESTCSFKSTSSKVAAQDTKDVRFLSTNEAAHTSHSGEASFKCTAFASGSMSHEHNIPNSNSHACDDNTCHHLIFKIEDAFVHVEPSLCKNGDRLSVHDIKVQAACLYYLRVTLDKRSRGLFPIIQRLEYDGKAVESLEAVDTVQEQLHGKRWMEVAIDAWVPKRLLKLYVDCCMELSEPPNLKLLMKLYNLEVSGSCDVLNYLWQLTSLFPSQNSSCSRKVSEDEVIVSDCELQDVSLAPLLNALNLHKTIAVLNLSHNLLGNETMEKLQKVFMSSSQKYGGLVLDLHCNRFGPTALFQICECPVLFARLEVLNVSGNRLTDGCSSYLSTILHNCKALYSLNIERCSITSRTVQKVADALDSSSVLAQLCIGYNNPISGTAIVNLVDKLATLKRFSELNLNGIKLSKHVVDSICQLVKSSCLSELMLGETSIGTDQALHLTESWTDETRELMKLDLFSCGLSSTYIIRLNNKVSLISSILELNLGGNPIMQEGGMAMAELLRNPECNLKILVLSKCQIGNVGVLSILQALSENCNLEELNLAENANLHEKQHTTVVPEERSKSLQNCLTSVDYSTKGPTHETESAQPNLSSFDAGYNYNMLEVADSEDELTGKKPSVSDLDDSCTSSLGKKCLYFESPFFYELSTAIYRAKTLRVLDLSNNGLPEQAAETLYSAWSSTRSRASSSVKHIQGQIVHLSVQGSICCGTKTCCRRV